MGGTSVTQERTKVRPDQGLRVHGIVKEGEGVEIPIKKGVPNFKRLLERPDTSV